MIKNRQCIEFKVVEISNIRIAKRSTEWDKIKGRKHAWR
jgi:hypothetical protein